VVSELVGGEGVEGVKENLAVTNSGMTNQVLSISSNLQYQDGS
jgi:hypothetical protein